MKADRSCGLRALLAVTALVYAFLLSGISASVERTVTFDLLGHFSVLDPESRAMGVSEDGAVVVGWSTKYEEPEAFRWEDGSMVGLGGRVDGWHQTIATGVSSDGSVIVGGRSQNSFVLGTTGPIEAVRWDDGILTGLGGFSNDNVLSRASAVSADGAVVAGFSAISDRREAVIWKDGVMTGLGYLYKGHLWSLSTGLSANGKVVVGGSDASVGAYAFRWESGVMNNLSDLRGGDYFSLALGVSADGAIVVGQSSSASGLEAFRTEGGNMRGLGDLPGGEFFSTADGISGDGTMVVGASRSGHSYTEDGEEAVFWSKENGWEIASLNDFLNSEGVKTNGYTLARATAISSDGTTIVGYGFHENGVIEAYRIHIVGPPPLLPEIVQPPQSLTAAPGSTATFTVETSGIEGETYQWKRDETTVGYGKTLTLYYVLAGHAGQYTVTVTYGEGSVTSRAVTLGVQRKPYDTEQMLNISTRGQILTGNRVMIAGFVLEGSGQKDVLIRGIGPTLGQWLTDVCPNPELALNMVLLPGQSTAFFEYNDNWGSLTEDIPGITQRVGGFPLIDGSKDSALYVNLNPGAYTAKVNGMDGTGVGLVELYDADLDPTASTCTLVNISTRGEVGTEAQILIAGFVIAGEVPKQVMIRGIGPRLADFQVEDTLADPSLRILKNVDPDQLWVASNDNWSDNPNAADIVTTSAAVGAFDLVDGSKDAVMLTWLEPGTYTAQVYGVGETTGVALVEVYEVK